MFTKIFDKLIGSNPRPIDEGPSPLALALNALESGSGGAQRTSAEEPPRHDEVALAQTDG